MSQTLYIKSLILLSGLFLLMSAGLSAQHSPLSERFKDVENVTISIWNGEEVAHREQKIHVKLREGISLESVLGQSLLTVTVKRPQNVLGWSVLRLDESTDLMETIEQLKAHPDVLEAEPVLVGETGVQPNDPDLYRQWALRNTGQAPTNGTAGADISAHFAWDITTGSEDVVVAILDTGIPLVQNTSTLSHPDLQNANRIILGPNFSDSQGNVRDENGHGTHVAGIVGAETSNATGIAGISWESNLLVIQTNDDFGVYNISSFQDAVIYASDYAVSSGKQVVINFSSGGGAGSQSYIDAINYAATRNVLIVAITHNDGSSNGIRYPARYAANYSNVMAVGATDHNDVRATYSNAGPQITMTAPGGFGGSGSGAGDVRNIYSTMPNYPLVVTQQQGFSQNYDYAFGTSMAAPHVAASASLMLSVNPTLSPSDLRDKLENTADWKSYMNSNEYGHGRLNAYEAVKQALPLQLENYAFTSSQTLSQKAHIFGSATVSSGVELTIATNNVAVIDGSLTSTGSSTAQMIVEGTLIADPNAILSGIRLTVADGGQVLLRDNVSLDTDGSSLFVSSDGQLTASEGFDLDMNGGMVNINGQADFGEQFSMSDGSISGGNSSELRIGSNSTLTFSPPCTSFKCIAGEGSLYSRGTVVLEGGAQGISLSAANAQVGGWSGMLLSGTAVTDPVLNNVTITQARNGLSLVNVDDLFVEGSLSISDSEFDGLRLINADLSWLSGIELNQNGRHGMWTDGAYVDYMSSIDLQYNTGAGLWAESGGWLEQGVNFAITDNTQNGIYTTGSVTLEITDSPIHGNSPRDANASGTSTQLITNNWWGQAPPAASQFYEAPFANQTYDPWQTSNTFPSSVAAREPDVRVGSQAKTRPLDAFRALHHSELSSAIAGLPRQQQAEGWITALDALLLEQSYTAVTELGQTLMAEAAEQAQPWGVAIGRRVLVARLMLGQHEAAAATLQWLDERRDGDAAPGHLYDLLTLMAPAGSGDAAPSGARPVAEGPQPATKTARVDFHNYPNPFNPSTMLSWELSEAGHVRVQVYDVNGRRVATLIDAPRQAGRHTARFDAANLASGMYFARMELAGEVFTRPMLLVK